jgi:diaminohydroxyphosphoribosylaminopyrimidine deaminase / 5-amino-6-(5-phosphoribosylamino)uracil reductase
MPENDQHKNDHHEKLMRRCIELALKAEGRTAPNPVVGAIVLDANGVVVGEGFHAKAGEDHAEVIALNQAGERANGGTLYVSLEPCSHHGKTPPCVNAVIASGIKHVVGASADPNPLVFGKGFDALRNAGIEVTTDICREESLWINRGFLSRMKRSRPWLCLKLASTLDGKIADRNGKSRWITGESARAYVQHLRNRFDCVLVGSTTARLDNPKLNVRDLESGRNPARAVIEGSTPLESDLRMFTSDKFGLGSTLIFCREDLYEKPRKPYPPGVKVVPIPTKDKFPDLAIVLKHLFEIGLNTILCEGGAKLAASLLNENLVDEVNWFFAPKILADSEAIQVVAGSVPKTLDEALSLKNMTIEQYGEDILVKGVRADNFMFSSGFLLPSSLKR